ncbi:MAG TPA: glycosyltransferase family 1 protein [Bacteroidota bacterium]
MRVAYFNANLKQGQDGVTRVMYKMFEGAVERDVDAIAFTSTLPDAQKTIIPMFRVPSVQLPLQKAYRLALPGYHTFARRLRAFDPDLIHINSPCTLGLAAIHYAKHFDVPVVATYHTHFPTYLRYYKMQGLEEVAWSISRCIYNQVDRTFVPTRPILDELRDHGISNLQYLPNGVDLTLFHPRHRSNEWRERFGAKDRPIVLFVSRLVWEKDLRVLAEAYSLLRSRNLDFEMVIVGDGPAQTELQRMMPGAHFLGYQSGKALAECFASADIFAFPSTTETFGLVTAEAMASGLAVVAAKAGGAVGIIEEGRTGLFAQPLKSADLAQKVEWLIDNQTERWKIAEQAIRSAQEFRWEKILSRLFTSYEDVIELRNEQRVAA